MELLCLPPGPGTSVVDNKDGSYMLEWRHLRSGTFRTRVTINGDDVIGSPTEFSLRSSTPDLSKSEMSGEGLKQCTAGQESSIKIKFVDQFGNTAVPGEGFDFGMAFLNVKTQRLTTHGSMHAFSCSHACATLTWTRALSIAL